MHRVLNDHYLRYGNIRCVALCKSTDYLPRSIVLQSFLVLTSFKTFQYLQKPYPLSTSCSTIRPKTQELWRTPEYVQSLLVVSRVLLVKGGSEVLVAKDYLV